mgnify:CR=1 FL=1
MNKKKFYITTPIYYVNDKPHLGHAYTSLATDTYARYKKLNKYEVFFATGTDEHGQKVEEAAKKKNMNTYEFTNLVSERFKQLTKKLELINNDFIRTTEERHKKSVQNLWNILEKNKQIYLSKYSGWYSVSDEAFYNEDEVIEINGAKASKSSGSAVEWVEEESFFFKLSEWEKPLLKFYEKNENFILPESRKNEVISFVKGGLKDLSVSRKTFSWGVKVPSNDEHVVYVWLDALTNYLSSLKYPDKNSDLYKSFWPADLHIIGKDILRFHAIYWPAFLLAANIEPPKRVYGHGWILSGDEKMSKSKGNILDPLEIINLYGLDPLRYYLLKEVSFGNDGNISEDKLENCINSDLANNFGNLCQRVLSFADKNCSSVIPDHKFNNDDLLILNSMANLDQIRSHIDNQNINEYMNFVVDRLFASNKYFNDQEPWKKKQDKIRLSTIVYTALELIRKITILLYPVMPETSIKVLNTFNINENEISILSLKNNEFLKKNNQLNKLDILFKKIEK